jgi:hypothetical protein
MNTQMYPFLRIAIVLVAGIMTGDVLYGHVPVRLVFCVLVVLVCITIVAYKKSGIPRLTTSLLMLDVFVLGVWNVGRVEQRLDVPLNGEEETIEAVVAERPVVGLRTIRCMLIVADGRLSCSQRDRSHHVARLLKELACLQRSIEVLQLVQSRPRRSSYVPAFNIIRQ